MSDAVDKPSHYKNSTELLEIIERWSLGFSLGNAAKYIFRAGKKDPTKTIEDLEKAAFYLNEEIKRLKNGAKIQAD